MRLRKPLSALRKIGGGGRNRTGVRGFAVRGVDTLQSLDLSRFPLIFGSDSLLKYHNDYRLESLENTQHHQPKLEVKGT